MSSTVSTIEMLNSFEDRHRELMQYVASLSAAELIYSYDDRWNAGQHLQHVYLCLKAMSKALGSKDYVLQSFGVIDRATKSREEVIAWYKEGLAGGGKSPERFEPGVFEPERKEALLKEMEEILAALRAQAGDYTEQELDTLVLPHPFLGKLRIREFCYLMTEHPVIHQQSIARSLQQRALPAGQ
jgi:hypothetical protein